MQEAAEYDEIIEQVVEWLGCQWRRCQIRDGLEKILGGKLENGLCDKIIDLARDRIRRRLNIDPDEFRGYSLTFYSSIVRNEKAGLKYRLHAQLRIDKLLGLETVSLEDPHAYAQALRAAISGMDEGVPKVKEQETKAEEADPDVSAAVASVQEFLKERTNAT